MFFLPFFLFVSISSSLHPPLAREQGESVEGIDRAIEKLNPARKEGVQRVTYLAKVVMARGSSSL